LSRQEGKLWSFGVLEFPNGRESRRNIATEDAENYDAPAAALHSL